MFRPNSNIHIIFLTDAPEQSLLSPAQMLTALHTKFPTQRVVAHGVICPESLPPPAAANSCGDDPELVSGKYHALIRQTGGVLGSIRVFNASPTPQLAAMQAVTMRAIIRSILEGAGYDLNFKPISASMHVAASSTGACIFNSDIPHDEDKGWSLDQGGKLSFSTCVPDPGAKTVVSYQSWGP